MKASKKKKGKMTLLYGGRKARFRIASITCRLVADWDRARPQPDALVFEEDTHLVLTVEPKRPIREEHPVRVMTELFQAKAHGPGSLVIKGRRWYAVVIDLDRDPMCRPAWIEEAYREIGRQVASRRLTDIGLHLLGQVHGGLDAETCAELFAGAVEGWRCDTLKNLWLLVPERSRTPVCRTLERYRCR